MSQPAYKPRAGTLDAEVLWYLSRHPGAALTCEDIDAKFDCIRGNIHTQLRPALDAGLMVRGMNEDGEITYAAGPNLVMHVEPNVPKLLSMVKASRNAPPLAIPTYGALDTIKIDDDIPPPVRPTPFDWKAKLLQLRPGQSFAVPLRHKFVLGSYMSQLHRDKKGTWTLSAKRETDQVRVWRLPDPDPTPATNPSTSQPTSP